MFGAVSFGVIGEKMKHGCYYSGLAMSFRQKSEVAPGWMDARVRSTYVLELGSRGDGLLLGKAMRELGGKLARVGMLMRS
ncbi:unnamed protein product [Dovyalis caffra]|uniref:Uncharacterized protein n=1 Tax=Dovyalis caffra TaxID=77055 RepID=A0AAV1RRA0_9ROSI|nr:unnamed protein product [Dovyalis caffra]